MKVPFRRDQLIEVTNSAALLVSDDSARSGASLLYVIWLGWFLVIWGAATVLTAVYKPPLLWNNAKIQGFVKAFKETGPVVFLGVIGVAAIAGGIAIVLAN